MGGVKKVWGGCERVRRGGSRGKERELRGGGRGGGEHGEKVKLFFSRTFFKEKLKKR